MASIINGFSYDIFISYRQKDNKGERWVSEFVDALKTEIEATFKEDISIYFDENPHDGLLETHDVAESLKEKLRCLIFIPIISRTYCDPKSYAWDNEFVAFVEQASNDRFGLKLKLPGGNVASRVLPVRIHDLEPEDIKLAEQYLGFIRPVDFIYKSAGVNRPLRANEDHPQDNLNKIYYRDQINKVANAIDEIIRGLKKIALVDGDTSSPARATEANDAKDFTRTGKSPGKSERKLKKWQILVLCILFCIPAVIATSKIIHRIRDAGSGGKSEKTIAVLPFRNLTNDTTQMYLCDGFTEEIADNLEKVSSFTVRSRPSSNQYRDTKKSYSTIGKELNANYLVAGDFSREGNRMKILARLIDTRTEKRKWSNKYDRNLNDILAVQSEISQTIASELKTELSPEELESIEKPLSKNPEAYSDYLRGNFYANDMEGNRALSNKYFESAIAKDPQFIQAYTQLANNLSRMYVFVKFSKGSDTLLVKCMEQIDRAFLLNPDSPEAHLALGLYFYRGFLDYEKALEQAEMVLKKQPQNAEALALAGWILRRKGDYDLAKIYQVKSLELNPRSYSMIGDVGVTFQSLRDYPKAEEYFNRYINVKPDNYMPYIQLSDIYVSWKGDTRKAREILEYGVSNNAFKHTDPMVIEYDLLLDIKEGQYQVALNKLLQFRSPAFESYNSVRPKHLYKAILYGLLKNPGLEYACYDTARIYLEKRLAESPDEPKILCTLGISYAGLKLKDKALKAGEQAVKSPKLENDVINKFYYLQKLATINVMLGNYSEALKQLDYLLSRPADISIHDLQLDPKWAPLKNLPEFQKLVSKYPVK
jgi:TolB-like protein/Tfp pilus assembly protein PilF